MSRGVRCIVTNTQEGILSSQHPFQRGPLVLTEAANSAVQEPIKFDGLLRRLTPRSSPLDARKDGCIRSFRIVFNDRKNLVLIIRIN